MRKSTEAVYDVIVVVGLVHTAAGLLVEMIWGVNYGFFLGQIVGIIFIWIVSRIRNCGSI